MPRIEPKAKERFAELHGLRATTVKEAATAMGFSVTTGETLMTQPEYRRIFEATRRGHGRGMQGEVAESVRLMLRAVNKDGIPNLAIRQKGVEAWLKNPEAVEGEDVNSLLPEGVLLLYPIPPGAHPEETPGAEEKA